MPVVHTPQKAPPPNNSQIHTSKRGEGQECLQEAAKRKKRGEGCSGVSARAVILHRGRRCQNETWTFSTYLHMIHHKHRWGWGERVVIGSGKNRRHLTPACRMPPRLPLTRTSEIEGSFTQRREHSDINKGAENDTFTQGQSRKADALMIMLTSHGSGYMAVSPGPQTSERNAVGLTHERHGIPLAYKKRETTNKTVVLPPKTYFFRE